jgi:hypothetical protein
MLQTLEVSDFKVMVVLKYFQVSIVDISKQDRRVVFHFDNTDGNAKKIWIDFLNGKLVVEPLLFYNTQENIKSLVMELVKGQNVETSYQKV